MREKGVSKFVPTPSQNNTTTSRDAITGQRIRLVPFGRGANLFFWPSLSELSLCNSVCLLTENKYCIDVSKDVSFITFVHGERDADIKTKS